MLFLERGGCANLSVSLRARERNLVEGSIVRSSVSFRRALRRPMTLAWHSEKTAPFGRPAGTGAAFPRGHADSRLAKQAGSRTRVRGARMRAPRREPDSVRRCLRIDERGIKQEAGLARPHAKWQGTEATLLEKEVQYEDSNRSEAPWSRPPVRASPGVLPGHCRAGGRRNKHKGKEGGRNGNT